MCRRWCSRAQAGLLGTGVVMGEIRKLVRRCSRVEQAIRGRSLPTHGRGRRAPIDNDFLHFRREKAMTVSPVAQRAAMLGALVLLLANRPASGDNDYCVVCQDKPASICHSDTGGEYGLFKCGLENPSCSIT